MPTEASPYITPPNSGWTYGQKVDAHPEGKEWVEAGEKAGWTGVDTATEDPRWVSLGSSAIVAKLTFGTQ